MRRSMPGGRPPSGSPPGSRPSPAAPFAGRRLAWALLAEPVDPAVEAERLHFRHSYRDLMAEVIAEGIEAGELPAQDVDATAAALIGAIGETMLGPPVRPLILFPHKRVAPLERPLRPRTTTPKR